MTKSGKRIRNSYANLDKNKIFSLDEAVAVTKKNAIAKFNETIEIALNLNVDPKKADQNVRGVLTLPKGIGKIVRVAVFTKDDTKILEAKEAGADIVGSEDLAQDIQNGKIDFDRCIATPDMMVLVGKLGKILGTRGLMPNPKLGSVTLNVSDAVKTAKAGQVHYRAEKAGVIHAGIGKADFSEEDLVHNIKSLVSTIVKARPHSVKGTFIKSFFISSTMGPSIRVNVGELLGTL